jgi:hypothetical protein
VKDIKKIEDVDVDAKKMEVVNVKKIEDVDVDVK